VAAAGNDPSSDSPVDPAGKNGYALQKMFTAENAEDAEIKHERRNCINLSFLCDLSVLCGEPQIIVLLDR
jgi:hypothetical protein